MFVPTHSLPPQVRSLFARRHAALLLSHADALQPSASEFGAIVRFACASKPALAQELLARAEMRTAVERMRDALRCTLAEQRQRAHWDENAAVPLAVFLALHFDEPESFVDAAVWGAVRADRRRIEELRQRLSATPTQLLLVSECAEVLAAGL